MKQDKLNKQTNKQKERKESKEPTCNSHLYSLLRLKIGPTSITKTKRYKNKKINEGSLPAMKHAKQ